VQRVQEAVAKFVRTVRERRQEGAALVISSNGRGKIDVVEHLPQGVRPPPATAPAEAPRLLGIERRLAELEKGLARIASAGEFAERIAHLEERIPALQSQLSRALAAADVAGPGFEPGRPGAQVIPRSSAGTRRTTAVEAYAEGLRHELLASASAAFGRSRIDTERCDKAAALAAEGELLGAPADGTAQRLREASAQAAARQSALEQVSQEIEFYAHADLPVAAQLLKRLEDGPGAPDAAPSLEPVAQAVVRAAKGGDAKVRTAWLKRAAALCSWQLVEPARGQPVDPEWHQAVDSGGDSVVRLASPGLKRVDGSGLVRARVHVDPAAAALPEEPDEPAAVPEPLSPPESQLARASSGPAMDELESPLELGGAPKTDRFPAPAREPDRAPAAARESGGAPAPAREPDPAPTPDPAHTRAHEPDPNPAPEGARPPDPEALPLPASTPPFGDITGEGEIRSEEAAAAAQAASRIPKIVDDDIIRSDEALAAEVALEVASAVETELSADEPGWGQFARRTESLAIRPAGPDEVADDLATVLDDEDLEGVHELSETPPDDPDPPGK
jgi:hypothetical protein